MRTISIRSLPGVCVVAVFLAVSCCVCTTQLWAQGKLDPSMATGTTSSTTRKQAIARIPFQQMSPAAAQKISGVVKSASLYRQLPVTTIQSDPDMYLFLLRYPETIISTWQLMGITEMSASRVAPFTLQANDGAGTNTKAELVYGQPKLNIYYAEGEYDGPMIFRKVTGKCVIMVESDYRRGADGQVHVTSRMNFFLKIDNLAASIIAKTIHPLVGTTADHNFVETMKFAEKLSETSARNGAGVQRMGNRLQGLTPEVRQRFQEIAGVVWQRAQGPESGNTTGMIQTGFAEPVQRAAAQQFQQQQPGNRQPVYQQPQQAPMYQRGPTYNRRPQHPAQSSQVPGNPGYRQSLGDSFQTRQSSYRDR